MSSLSAGKHTVKVNFTDGSAETTLTVAQKDTKDTGKTDVGKKPASNQQKQETTVTCLHGSSY